MPTLADLVARLESGGTAHGAALNAAQNPTMVNPFFGQYNGFVQQYGSGAAGINNFGAQTLAANPNATFGDFYAGYVRGTGTPGQFSLSDLQAVNSGGQAGAGGAYTNLTNNAGPFVNTPLSSFFDSNGNAVNVSPGGGQVATGPLDASSSLQAGSNIQTAAVVNNNDQLFPSNFDQRFGAAFPNSNQPSMGTFFDPNAIGEQTQFTQGGGAASGIVSSDLSTDQSSVQPQVATNTLSPVPESTATDITKPSAAQSLTGIAASGEDGAPVKLIPSASLTELVKTTASNIEGAFGSGLQTALNAGTTTFSKYLTSAENFFLRGGLYFVGGVIIIIALLYLMRPKDLSVGEIVAAAKAGA